VKTRVQRAGEGCWGAFRPLGYELMTEERRPTLKSSEPHWPAPGQEALDLRMPSSRLRLAMVAPVRGAVARGYSRLSADRRRRCGNVEIARLGFWRDFQARWEAWKSPALPSRPRWPSAGLFHAFHGASFPQRVSHNPFDLGAPCWGTDRFCGGSLFVPLTLVENLLSVR
jgi:hypothetical protein